jgi:hypothetical protein
VRTACGSAAVAFVEATGTATAIVNRESSMWQRDLDPGTGEGKRWRWFGIVARFFEAKAK